MSVNLVYHKDEPERFAALWDRYVSETSAGPRYLRSFLNYFLDISSSRGFLLEDKSFVYVVNNEPAACVFLPLEKQENICAFTYDGAYAPAPLCRDVSVERKVFNAVDALAREAGAAKAMFQIDPLELGKSPYNFLQVYGYRDTSILSYLYDLSVGDPLQSARRNHVRNLKRILGDPRFEVVRIDREHPSREHHESYERLHEKCAGRKTRPTSTFDKQYEQLLAGEAVLFCVLFEGKPAAYGYFLEANGKALYVSTSDDPDIQGYPLNHLLTYAGIEHYRKRGVAVMTPSDPASPSRQFDYWPDEKVLGITLFKTGFAGRYAPLFRGVRYFDPSLVAADAERFAKRYPGSSSLFSEHA